MADEGDADQRLRCYEYGATVQAELHFAERTIESIETRASAPDEVLVLPDAEVRVDKSSIMEIHEETLNSHLERAVDALENGAFCGLPSHTIEAVGDAYAEIKRQVREGNYTLARMNVNKLRARLRHPAVEFG